MTGYSFLFHRQSIIRPQSKIVVDGRTSTFSLSDRQKKKKKEKDRTLIDVMYEARHISLLQEMKGVLKINFAFFPSVENIT